MYALPHHIPHYPLCPTLGSSHTTQPNHTHQNSNITAAKKPTQAFHPTPVFCAIRNIRFIVPLILCREFSNWSFILSAREEDSRISSPMRWVNCTRDCQYASRQVKGTSVKKKGGVSEGERERGRGERDNIHPSTS